MSEGKAGSIPASGGTVVRMRLAELDIAQRIVVMARTDIEVGELGPWSTGEKIAVCIVLNRGDWLTRIGYTMLEAIDRLGPDWLAGCQIAAKELGRG
jgi:hypothetical protein